MKCLLVAPRFSEFSYWNYREVCELFDARYPAAPLGLVTVAALLPRDWEIRLLDLNVCEMDTALLEWADLVPAGGMLPQQRTLLALIDVCHAHGKRIALGGQDPTSQPEIYAAAVISCWTRARSRSRCSSPTSPAAPRMERIARRRSRTSPRVRRRGSISSSSTSTCTSASSSRGVITFLREYFAPVRVAQAADTQILGLRA
jgi:hypothetical protein